MLISIDLSLSSQRTVREKGKSKEEERLELEDYYRSCQGDMKNELHWYLSDESQFRAALLGSVGGWGDSPLAGPGTVL